MVLFLLLYCFVVLMAQLDSKEVRWNGSSILSTPLIVLPLSKLWKNKFHYWFRNICTWLWRDRNFHCRSLNFLQEYVVQRLSARVMDLELKSWLRHLRDAWYLVGQVSQPWSLNFFVDKLRINIYVIVLKPYLSYKPKWEIMYIKHLENSKC